MYGSGKKGYVLALSTKEKGPILDAEAVHVSFLEILKAAIGPKQNKYFSMVVQ
ncbi:hypothetical protein I2486_17915 [Cellulophaga sp. E16_2]|uniref:Uncharacterized protein n=1 Tax=Cellulophaga algicola (strain DSM 14237 / IC166 / ACAM 630) TaxID=688270 RepID=E6X986_CELAD|nr:MULTISPECIES: hypothetical protein [Cellulophaga]ADV50896.1 hypothetical protein Celal_3641 [Cellulophaga algicola DSM 14237]MBO0593282.1 hypothetical protein [Cellulophaga sp. E16_2]